MHIPLCVFFFFNDTATTEIYTLSLHDALPIHDGQAVVEGHAVHEIALAETAARARRPACDLLDHGHRPADLIGHARHEQPRAAARRERLALRLRLHRIVEDAEVQIEAGRVVAVVDEDVPQRQRVLAARHGHQHTLVAREHAVLADRLAHLVAEELQVVVDAKGGVVAPQLDGGAVAALAALHARPPDITGRSSMTSSSRSSWSAVTRSSPRMTSTVSG